MKVLITRSLEQGKVTAWKFKGLKADLFLEPLVSIKNSKLTSKQKEKVKAADALVFTSSNAVKAFASQIKSRGFNAIAVGDKTASELNNIGFTKVTSAQGSLDVLKDYIKKEKGQVIYLSGNVVTEKLEEVFPGKVTRLKIYSSEYKKALSKKLQDEIKLGVITHALFYSEQTALVFLELINKHKLLSSAQKITALCLSLRIAKTFKNQGFKKVRSSSAPSEKTLLGMLKDFG